MLIWWTSKEDCKEIVELTGEAPDYLRKQFNLRHDDPLPLPGGRLWIDDRVSKVLLPNRVKCAGGIPIEKWPDGADIKQFMMCGGIPIYERDIDWVVNLPGYLTDVEMRKLEFV